MREKSNIKLVKDVFTEENTNLFLLALDLVLKTIDYYQIEKLLKKFDIHHDPECVIFLENMRNIFEDWKIEGNGSALVDTVGTRITKCYACLLGKNVTAYEFFYQHKGLEGFESRIVYGREFALFTETKNGCLIDFGVCNAFLDKEDVRILTLS